MRLAFGADVKTWREYTKSMGMKREGKKITKKNVVYLKGVLKEYGKKKIVKGRE